MSGISGKVAGFLSRLLHDRRGNTLAMVAAGMIPMAGLIGGGIDMSRIYLTKTRMQQACDAGALTARKTMATGSWAYNSYSAQTAGYRMFDANFAPGAYGSGTVTRTYSENAGKVTGAASVPLPMTMMKIFGQQSRTIAVNCDAEMRIPNTDVMFVLDNTGSMGETNVGDTSSKLVGLKKAVKCFYEALAKLDTTADCGSTPSGGNSATVQLRFGFVPYSSNVNVGSLLKNDWMADSWTYQSREAQYTTSASQQWVQQGNPTVTVQNVSYTNVAQSSCNDTTAATLNTSSDAYSNNNNTKRTTTVVYDATGWRSANNGTCDGTATTTVTVYNKTTVNTPTFSGWIYKPMTYAVSGLKAGNSSWNSSLTLPLGSNGVDTSVDWDGCIEERQTFRNSDGDPSNEFNPIPATAIDLDINRIPSTTDATTQWKPSLPDAVWGRYDPNNGNKSYTNITTTTEESRNYSYACPTAARKLASYATASSFESYVNSLVANGNTYHDIGILWGARLMSPTGLFASENAYTPSGGTIERHMIFMTDGDTNTSQTDYNAYGIPWWDRRQTSTSSAPSNTLLDAEVDARFPALCTAVKNMNITLWVISYGNNVSTSTETRLSNCATPGKYFSASNTSTLISNFQQIADEISQLRLTN